MTKRNGWLALLGIAVFIGLLGLAIRWQSDRVLFAASLVPIVVVPLLPDLRSSQWLKQSRSRGINMFRIAGPDGDVSDLLIIEFKPGTIDWRKRRLYVSLSQLPVAPSAGQSPATVALSVLKYDLVPHRRKPNTYGIELKNLVQRTRALPYTPKEVNRLVLRYHDIAELSNKRTLPVTAGAQRGAEA